MEISLVIFTWTVTGKFDNKEDMNERYGVKG